MLGGSAYKVIVRWRKASSWIHKICKFRARYISGELAVPSRITLNIGKTTVRYD